MSGSGIAREESKKPPKMVASRMAKLVTFIASKRVWGTIEVFLGSIETNSHVEKQNDWKKWIATDAINTTKGEMVVIIMSNKTP